MTTNLKIAQLGNDVLRKIAAPVDDFNCAEFRLFLNTLENAMLEANGVGIAAPQLGVAQRIIIIASRPTPRYPLAPLIDPIIMINPDFEIIDAAQQKDWEGCLSVPGIRALVPRYQAVKVSYQTQHGEFRQISLADFPARVFQHEFDHLQGLVYLDRVTDNRDIISESEFFKRIAA